MRTYRSILKTKLKDAGLTHRQIAEAMGWKSNSTVSLKLDGKRDWGEGELARMATLAGVSVTWLAENSDDLVIAQNRSTVTIAAIADGLTEEQRQLLISFTQQMTSK
jgi:transcriptional regulator with XRE-family HTH domain